MVTVAILLLPGLGLLLFGMTCLEDRLFGDPAPRRHARHRHLRLIPGGRSHRSLGPRPEPAQAHASERDAA
ncbi:hypothetical protein AB0P07_26285 [Streptomyces sp. NPDC085944]|uniref:hypothetical protein n=1 Tax=Streptomyces sp. NPDC085944 TaxID=3154962 RepID=UPI003425E5BF